MVENKSLHNSSSQESSSIGLVHVFTGDGKGKTSAALGVTLRALGQGLKVYIVFFMKGNYSYGERNVLSELPNVKFDSFGGKGFIDPKNIKPEDIEQASLALAAAHKAMLSGKYDLVVLDEVNVAVAFKLVEVDEVIKLLNDKPQNVHLILTGRRADAEIVKRADLVTEMLKIKHPYDKGIKAQKGVDFEPYKKEVL